MLIIQLNKKKYNCFTKEESVLMIINKDKLMLEYIKHAIKSKSFSDTRVRTFIEKEDFSPFYIYKHFENFEDLKRKSAEFFVRQNLTNGYVNFDNTYFSKLAYETENYFGKHEYRDILFLDEYCGKIVMEKYYVPALKKIFNTHNEKEIIFKYTTIVGIILKK